MLKKKKKKLTSHQKQEKRRQWAIILSSENIFYLLKNEGNHFQKKQNLKELVTSRPASRNAKSTFAKAK